MKVIRMLGTVLFVSVGTLIWLGLILKSGRFEYQWASFVVYLAVEVGGLWWVLNGDRPSPAREGKIGFVALGMLYTALALLVGRQGSPMMIDPLIPFLVIVGTAGFMIAAVRMPERPGDVQPVQAAAKVVPASKVSVGSKGCVLPGGFYQPNHSAQVGSG
jgi:hypothetical protein